MVYFSWLTKAEGCVLAGVLSEGQLQELANCYGKDIDANLRFARHHTHLLLNEREKEKAAKTVFLLTSLPSKGSVIVLGISFLSGQHGGRSAVHNLSPKIVTVSLMRDPHR